MANTVAAVFGALYLLTGVLGFIMTPGGGVFLGIFAVNWFHHLFHILLGGLGPLAAWRNKGAFYCRAAGVILILLGVLGLILPGLVANLLAVPPADLLTDNLLHLVSGSALLYFGFASRPASGPGKEQNRTLPR